MKRIAEITNLSLKNVCSFFLFHHRLLLVESNLNYYSDLGDFDLGDFGTLGTLGTLGDFGTDVGTDVFGTLGAFNSLSGSKD